MLEVDLKGKLLLLLQAGVNDPAVTELDLSSGNLTRCVLCMATRDDGIEHASATAKVRMIRGQNQF